MSNMSNLKIETGSSPAEERFSITVTETGPYLVYGRPPLAEQFIMPDESNDSWYFQEGRHFSTESEPTALCRCGASRQSILVGISHEWTGIISRIFWCKIYGAFQFTGSANRFYRFPIGRTT